MWQLVGGGCGLAWFCLGFYRVFIGFYSGFYRFVDCFSGDFLFLSLTSLGLFWNMFHFF